VVLNNGLLGMVAQWQRMGIGGARSKRYSAVKLGNVPDFAKLAEAYGAKGARVETLDGFVEAAKRAVKSDVTTVIDVPISPEENVFPLVPAGGALRDMMWE